MKLGDRTGGFEVRALIAVLLAGLALGGCASTEQAELPQPPAQPVFDRVIVPGQRVGPVALGMQAAQLLQSLGAPVRSSHDFSDGSWNTFSNGMAVFVRDSDNRVSMINIESAEFATEHGVGVGSSEIEIRSRMGAPYQAAQRPLGRVLCYSGMHVILNQDGRVQSLGVAKQYTC